MMQYLPMVRSRAVRYLLRVTITFILNQWMLYINIICLSLVTIYSPVRTFLEKLFCQYRAKFADRQIKQILLCVCRHRYVVFLLFAQLWKVHNAVQACHRSLGHVARIHDVISEKHIKLSRAQSIDRAARCSSPRNTSIAQGSCLRDRPILCTDLSHLTFRTYI